MRIKHYYIEKIAHSSYILAGDKTCAVVDPARDVDLYICEAEKLGLKITHVLETHLHADFVSGHLELAQRTGADIFISATAGAQFPHTALHEGDVFHVEDMKIHVLETPGHTPEHISFIVTNTSTGEDPVAAFVGDTLFVGDAGRPDLFPNRAEELAKKLYVSLFDKLLKLPDFCEVYPAHGAGSLCGKAVGAKYTTTIGYEKKYNPVLQEKDVNQFVKLLTQDMPGAPDHFSRGSKLNAQGPKPLHRIPDLERMSPKRFALSMARQDTVTVDVRSYVSFGGAHLPGSYCLDHTGNLPTFAGWVLPPDKNILLVGEDHHMAKEAACWLYRVGLDNVTGFLEGGVHAWMASGLPLSKVEQLGPEEYASIKEDPDLFLVDARDPQAFKKDHIPGAINIPAPDLRTRHSALPKEKTILVICNSGVRSSLGVSILKQNGFENVKNFAGGMKGYLAFHGK